MRIVIVGHGPSLDGRRWGHEIDGSDAVIRMHDWHWQSCPDHGVRYDYGVLPGPWLDRATAAIETAPARGWLCYRLPGQRIKARPPAVILNRPVTVFEESLCELLIELGRFSPTRGLMGVAMAAMKFSRSKLILAGLDGLRTGIIGPYARQCPARPAQGEGGPRSCRHAYDLERKALRFIAARSNVEIAFAEDVWS